MENKSPGPYVVGIGAANIDLCGRSRRPIIMEDSNPGSFTMSVGGVTRNICENAARMGLNVSLITTLGEDVYGQVIREECARAGLDLSASVTFAGSSSSTYLSIHDSNGEMTVAMSDMSILQQMTIDHLRQRDALIRGASAVVMDCGLPEAILTYVLETYGSLLPVFIDPVSTAYAQKLTGGRLKGCHTVKPNQMELEILADGEKNVEQAARQALKAGAQRVVATLGREGAYYLARDGQAIRRRAVPAKVINATGAGDCFTAGLLYSLVHQLSAEETLAFSMAAASLALSHEKTINPMLNEKRILEQMAEEERFIARQTPL